MVSDTPQVGAPPAGAIVHEVQIDRGPAGDSRRLLTRVGVVVVVLALVGAGVVAVQGFGSSGGSTTPESAVEELFRALGNEDFLGAAEVVEPGERRTLVDPAIDMVGELKRLRVLASDFDLGSVSGIDLEFADLTYSAEPLGAGVARVEVDGTVTATGDVTELDLGDLVMDNIPAADLQLMQDEAATASTEAIEAVGLVTVERDGRWYVSLWYSVAEAARRSSNAPLPEFGAGPTPVGGETPEEAVQNLADEAAQLDLGGVIAQLDPEEMAALYDYSTLFIDEADAAVADLLTDDPMFTATIDRLDLRSDVDGDDAVVFIDGIALTIAGRDGRVDIDTEAECLVFSLDEWNPQGRCEIARRDLSGENEWNLDLGLDDLPSPSVRAHRVGDRWFVSPTASLVQPGLDVLRVLEADQLQRWADDPESFFDELPDVLAAAPESAGLAVAGLGGIYALGQSVEQSFSEIEGSFDGSFDEVDESPAFELDNPPLIELDEPPVLELDDPPLIELEVPTPNRPPVAVDEPPLIEPAEPFAALVWVVTTDVAAGTPLTAEHVQQIEVPVEFVPDGAVVDLEGLDRPVAAFDLAPGQVLVFAMLGGV